MCHLSVEVDQSIHTVSPVFDEIDRSPFFIRSVYVVPVAWSRRSTVNLSLGGGSTNDLSRLLNKLSRLPAVRSIEHTPMPAEI